jgi:hypothetical protein
MRGGTVLQEKGRVFVKLAATRKKIRHPALDAGSLSSGLAGERSRLFGRDDEVIGDEPGAAGPPPVGTDKV